MGVDISRSDIVEDVVDGGAVPSGKFVSRDVCHTLNQETLTVDNNHRCFHQQIPTCDL
jgi:hypothetical protein